MTITADDGLTAAQLHPFHMIFTRPNDCETYKINIQIVLQVEYFDKSNVFKIYNIYIFHIIFHKFRNSMLLFTRDDVLLKSDISFPQCLCPDSF